MKMPVHPRTGLAAVGVVGGRPVWPVLGAEDPPDGGGNGDQQSTMPSGGQEPTSGQQPSNSTPEPPQKVEDLPDWAQKLIRDTRSEAAQHRTSKQQAEQEKQATLDAIATALGLKQGEQADPEKLTRDLQAAQSESRQRAIELAVYRKAAEGGGDPDALLDSRSFTEKVHELDPNASDFLDRVTDAVKSAVSANPKLAPATVTATTSAMSTAARQGQGRREESNTRGVASGWELYEQRKGKTNRASIS